MYCDTTPQQPGSACHDTINCIVTPTAKPLLLPQYTWCIATQTPQQPHVQTATSRYNFHCIVTHSSNHCTPYVVIQFYSPLHTHEAMSRYNFPLYRDTVWAVAQNSFCTFFFSFFTHIFFLHFCYWKHTKKKYIYIYIYSHFFSLSSTPNKFIKIYFLFFFFSFTYCKT